MRRYGQTKTDEENPSNCIAEIRVDRFLYQCARKRGHGPGKAFCAQHGAMKDKGRYVSVPEEGP